MESLKKYARQAKERMKNGFWQQTREQANKEKEVAATLGVDSVKFLEQQRRQLTRRIYDADGYEEERRFYLRVVEILESDQLVTDPLAQLADKEQLAQMDEREKQAYFLKLSAKFREAVDKYRLCGGKIVG